MAVTVKQESPTIGASHDSSDDSSHTPRNNINDAPNSHADSADKENQTNDDDSSSKQQKQKNNPDKPKAFTIKYKRPRGSRACVVCRSRKVRCDAEMHIPCTNCITFGCECTLPEARKRGNASAESKAKRQRAADAAAADSFANTNHTHSAPSSTTPASGTMSATLDTSKNPNADADSNTAASFLPATAVKTELPSLDKSTTTKEKSKTGKSSSPPKPSSNEKPNEKSSHSYSHPQTSSASEPVLNISQVSVPPSLTSNYKTRPSMHKRELVNSHNENGAQHKPSLTFLGSSSISLVTQKVGQNHVSLAEDIFDVSENSLDSVELEILKLRGAFLLPSNKLARDIIDSYFEHVHPLMPVINRTEFMAKFNDPDDSPSLMLLQAVLLCGCRVSRNPLLLDSRGSNNLACLTFFRRAKALYETNYESDPVSIIQTVILIGSYWEGPEDVTRNSFYWTRVAVSLAQGFGFQRDISGSPDLSASEKKIWRRIWWCLFEKDRNVAIAFGRPNVIDLNDCDVPMLTMDDFNEDDPELGIVSPYPVNEIQALYFIHLVKLAEITGIIIKHQYTVKAESMKRKNKFSIIQHCDMLMGIWFINLPSQLVFSLTDSESQNFYSSLLNAQYYNRLYLIHRANLLRMARSSSTNPNNYKYPSWGISFQAARMISIVSKILLDKGQLIYCPAMFVYILFSALMMLIYHVDSPNAVIASTASDSLFISRAVLKELSIYWPIAGVLMRLFDKYANNKIKRAKVIENGTKIAELEEINAHKSARNPEHEISDYYSNGSNDNINKAPGQGSSSAESVRHTVDGLDSVSPSQTVGKSTDSHPGAHGSKAGPKVEPPFDSSDYGVSPSATTTTSQDNLDAAAGSINVKTEHDSPFWRHQSGDELSPHSLQQASHQQSQREQQKQRPTARRTRSKTKQQKAHKRKGETNGSSPTSSTNSFPDISLVTENLHANQNFFENFDPTQLFPTANISVPPTRAQTPSQLLNTSAFLDGHADADGEPEASAGTNGGDGNANGDSSEIVKGEPASPGSRAASSGPNGTHVNPLTFGSNIYGTTANVPTTPGEALNANFIDGSFLNMTMPPPNADGEDFASLFNFQI